MKLSNRFTRSDSRNATASGGPTYRHLSFTGSTIRESASRGGPGRHLSPSRPQAPVQGRPPELCRALQALQQDGGRRAGKLPGATHLAGTAEAEGLGECGRGNSTHVPDPRNPEDQPATLLPGVKTLDLENLLAVLDKDSRPARAPR